jgi:anti-sigma regulatory factor (Ser/Thr protein kinase)
VLEALKKIELNIALNSYERVMTFIESQLLETSVDNSDRIKILTASEEIIINIINYADSNHEGNLEIIFNQQHDSTSITFIDDGKLFNPLEKPDADITLSLEEREIGGLGILMVKNLMDEVKYEYINNKNCLTIIKRISK